MLTLRCVRKSFGSTAEILLPCAVLCGVGVACFALGVRMFRWTAEG